MRDDGGMRYEIMNGNLWATLCLVRGVITAWIWSASMARRPRAQSSASPRLKQLAHCDAVLVTGTVCHVDTQWARFNNAHHPPCIFPSRGEI
jgi:hypothetical protein